MFAVVSPSAAALTCVGGVGTTLSSVVTLAAVLAADTFPAASTATTVYEYVRADSSPASSYGVVALVATCTPSRRMRYPVTPTLSVAAVQSSRTLVALSTTACNPVGAVGAVPSGVVTTAGALCADTLPAPSTAATVYE